MTYTNMNDDDKFENAVNFIMQFLKPSITCSQTS